jgi:hypothetical protein
MSCHSRGLAGGGHDDCFLIVDRVGQDFVVGVRAHTGEVSTVYLMDVDIEKLVQFLSQRRNYGLRNMVGCSSHSARRTFSPCVQEDQRRAGSLRDVQLVHTPTSAPR